MSSLTDIKRRRSKGEVKVYKQNLYFTILDYLKDDLTPSEISKILKRSKQNINHYISVLKKLGYLRKIGYGTWELTKGAKIERSKVFPQGSSKGDFKIEIWRLGYRFLIEHDNPIKPLKRQKLRNNAEFYQGRIMDCWVMKGKNTLDIYGTVSKSDKLWDAVMLALSQVITCKGHIEDKYHLLLSPMKPLKPDIIINTPETKRIANQVNEELGRLRTEYFDIGDSSKTKAPEFEARTLDKAQNVIDNLGIENKADKIIEILEKIETRLEPTLNRLANSIDIMTQSNKEYRIPTSDN